VGDFLVNEPSTGIICCGSRRPNERQFCGCGVSRVGRSSSSCHHAPMRRPHGGICIPIATASAVQHELHNRRFDSIAWANVCRIFKIARRLSFFARHRRRTRDLD